MTEYNWHPGVEFTEMLSPEVSGLGATRRCTFYDGSTVVEKVVDVPNENSILIEITGFAAPMNSFHSEWRAVETPSGSTQITVVMSYEMKFGFFGDVMNALLVKGRMSKLVDKVLAGLEHHILSGELIGKEFGETARSVA